MGVLAQAKNDDEQFWKQKFHAVNGKAQHALMNDPVFSYSKEGGGKQGFFSPPFSQCVFIIFPFSFQRVLKFRMRSPKMCPIVPGFYLIWFSQSFVMPVHALIHDGQLRACP